MILTKLDDCPYQGLVNVLMFHITISILFHLQQILVLVMWSKSPKPWDIYQTLLIDAYWPSWWGRSCRSFSAVKHWPSSSSRWYRSAAMISPCPEAPSRWSGAWKIGDFTMRNRTSIGWFFWSFLWGDHLKITCKWPFLGDIRPTIWCLGVSDTKAYHLKTVMFLR